MKFFQIPSGENPNDFKLHFFHGGEKYFTKVKNKNTNKKKEFACKLKTRCCLECGNLFLGAKNRKFCNNCVVIYKKFSGRDLIRQMVRLRDKNTCRDCGIEWIVGDKRFDVHHLNGLCGKKSRKYDRIEDIDGLITLCHRCHFNRPEHTVKKRLLTNV